MPDTTETDDMALAIKRAQERWGVASVAEVDPTAMALVDKLVAQARTIEQQAVRLRHQEVHTQNLQGNLAKALKLLAELNPGAADINLYALRNQAKALLTDLETFT